MEPLLPLGGNKNKSASQFRFRFDFVRWNPLYFSFIYLFFFVFPFGILFKEIDIDILLFFFLRVCVSIPYNPTRPIMKILLIIYANNLATPPFPGLRSVSCSVKRSWLLTAPTKRQTTKATKVGIPLHSPWWSGHSRSRVLEAYRDPIFRVGQFSVAIDPRNRRFWNL